MTKFILEIELEDDECFSCIMLDEGECNGWYCLATNPEKIISLDLSDLHNKRPDWCPLKKVEDNGTRI